MANVLIDQNTMIAIGNAIREKLGETDTYLPAEMPDKILSIVGGGSGPSIGGFKWGDETEVADAAWWNELKSKLPSMSASDRKSFVGLQKGLGFTSTYYNKTEHTALCIGADHDGTGTLTFMMVASSGAYLGQYSSIIYKNDSLRTEVAAGANICVAKDALKAASRECSNGSAASALTTITDKFCLPSITEITGGNTGYGTAEGTQYDYFKIIANRKFDVQDGIWTRSRGNASASNEMYAIDKSGSAVSTSIQVGGFLNITRNIYPLFVIG